LGVANASPKTAEPYRVVVTTGMLADVMRVVGGDAIAVKALMGPGVDPHAYRQTRSDIVALTKADLVVWHGLYLEAQLEEFMVNLGKQKQVVALGEAVPRELRLAHDDYAGRYDPHVWMNPRLWQYVVAEAARVLSAEFPDSVEMFATNAAAYSAELARLADYADATLSSVSEPGRVLVTAHDAFNYFGVAYGFDVIGIQGISTESEAGLRRIEDLVDRLVRDDIRAVFVESSVSDRNVRALIEGAAARGHTVSIGGELFSDAMGRDDTYEGTYLGMIDHNVTTITNALGGVAPVNGRLGNLGGGT
jgi:manganese/zinc/iron transport system substrate-binding protein